MLPRRRATSRPGRSPGLDAAGAIARRGWRSWTTDPRYLASLVAGVVFPLAIVVLAVAATGERTLAVAAGDQELVSRADRALARLYWEAGQDVELTRTRAELEASLDVLPPFAGG